MVPARAAEGCVNERIRILYTIPNFITAGSGRAMLNIIERLDRSRFDPSVAVLKKGGRLDAEVERLGIPLLEHPFTVEAKPYGGFPRRAWRAAAAFRPHRFDIWHSFHYSNDYSEAVIARLAGVRAWVYTKKNMNWQNNAWHLRTLFASGVAAQNSDMIRSFFGHPLYARKTVLLPRGVDLERFRAAEDDPVSDDGIVSVGCLAHLVPVKGHPTLLRAVAQVPGCELHIAGREADAEYAVELHELCRELGLDGRVVFHGDVANTPAFVHAMEIMVLPTLGRGEGCPVALLEAMATGRACIATDIPGSRDIIRSGVDGLLVPPEDVAALVRALHGLVSDHDRRRAFGRAARRRVEECYSLDREVRAHERFYERVLGRGMMADPA